MRYVHLPSAAVDTTLLEDATRRGRHKVCKYVGWDELIQRLQRHNKRRRRRREHERHKTFVIIRRQSRSAYGSITAGEDTGAARPSSSALTRTGHNVVKVGKTEYETLQSCGSIMGTLQDVHAGQRNLVGTKVPVTWPRLRGIH